MPPTDTTFQHQVVDGNGIIHRCALYDFCECFVIHFVRFIIHSFREKCLHNDCNMSHIFWERKTWLPKIPRLAVLQLYAGIIPDAFREPTSPFFYQILAITRKFFSCNSIPE